MRLNIGWGVLLGVAVWLAQDAAQMLATRPSAILIGSPLLVPLNGDAVRALIETCLLAGLIGMLAARARTGAIAAGGSYALTHYAPAMAQFVLMALDRWTVGFDPAFIGFIERALLWTTANELAFVAVAMAGGALGGALAGGLSRLTQRVVVDPVVDLAVSRGVSTTEEKECSSH